MRSLAFGEILWDISGSGRTLGGAPLNVAGHIVRLGGQAMIVSALGNDSLGHDAAAALDGLGVDSSLVHRSSCATGYAEILLEDGIPSYRFNDPAAWDGVVHPKLSKIILTQGSKGSACYERGRVSRSGCGRGRVVSTVGAGDSLSAAFLFFNSLGLESAVCLKKASMVADYVVARQAAIPEYDSVLMRSLGLPKSAISGSSARL